MRYVNPRNYSKNWEIPLSLINALQKLDSSSPNSTLNLLLHRFFHFSCFPPHTLTPHFFSKKDIFLKLTNSAFYLYSSSQDTFLPLPFLTSASIHILPLSKTPKFCSPLPTSLVNHTVGDTAFPLLLNIINSSVIFKDTSAYIQIPIPDSLNMGLKFFISIPHLFCLQYSHINSQKTKGKFSLVPRCSLY